MVYAHSEGDESNSCAYVAKASALIISLKHSISSSATMLCILFLQHHTKIEFIR